MPFHFCIIRRLRNAMRCGAARLGAAALMLVAGNMLSSAAWAARFPLEAPSLPATYLSQRIFMLPYQLNASDPLASEVQKVRLLVSRGGGGEWATLQEAEPNVRGFSYHCPDEGEYWFAVQMVDRRGNAWPSGEITPQLRLVVDTQKPQLKLEANADAQGAVIIRYSARDPNLQADSLRIELQADGGLWQAASIPPADVTQPDRLLGRFQWKAPHDARQLRVRATIADAGKLQTVELAEINSQGSRQGEDSQSERRDASEELEVGPNVVGPNLAAADSRNAQANRNLSSQEWPALNEPQRHQPLPLVRVPANVPSEREPFDQSRFERDFAQTPAQSASTATLPPFQNPYTHSNSTHSPGRTPAQFAADSRQDASAVDAPPLSGDYAPPTTPQTGPSAGTSWQAANSSAGGSFDANAASMLVNSRTFDLEYDLQTVGRWGVAKVEIWGSGDGGQTWNSYAVDPDNRSPIRVTVPGGGTFGLQILVDGANGAAARRPQPGDAPELVVQVDLHPPTTELIAAELGRGALADNLLIQWAAADTNLEPRPIGLYYSAYSEGPWSTIATGVENTGQYAWRIERHIPERFFLKVEARDTAGNITSAQTPTPVALQRPQPAGRLRGVRPIDDPRQRVPTVRPFGPPPHPADQFRAADQLRASDQLGPANQLRPAEQSQPVNRLRPAGQIQPGDQTAMDRPRGQH